MNGKILGVIYSERILPAKVSNKSIGRNNLSSLTTSQGSAIEIIGMNFLPEIQEKGWDAQCLEFLLYWFTISGIEQLDGITDPQSYIDRAHIVKKKDIFQPNELETKSIEVKENQFKEQLVEESIRYILGEQRMTAYSPSRPLMEMGLDSLELLELRTLLSDRLGVELEPTFFFQYGTPKAIIGYFNKKGKESEENLVEECIRYILGEQRMTAYSPSRPLMEMGLDSLELLELRTLLSDRLGVELEPTFFFQYGTPKAIIGYFNKKGKESEENLVEECIRYILGEQRMTAYSPSRPLMEMGLDSLELLELRTLLSDRFGVELEPTFFFQYGTPKAIIGYFNNQKFEQEQSIIRSLYDLNENEKEIKSEYDYDFYEAQSEDLIAIIGMACRLPGGVNSTAEYWSLLRNGVRLVLTRSL
ncbi:acyl carrier protein [Moorena bouillonii]|uniref:Carrier domain-containing protein n=1 Tax=Moorena bouillonii PNG TaxID=568701 RepID=A0A1U7MWI3_9CYAN|nr:acyl carrier protein [Moorena bouillonii]OLT58077.1 hypothetical protein BJP37_02475 [Moorena bouillonii PNG]